MASSGQVDVIISEKAIADIKNAIVELDALSKKILEVNEAGANRGGGINNNKEIIQELQSLNKLIATNKEVTETIKTKAAAQNKSKTAHAGSANALNNQISKLKKQQAALTTSNRSWLQYEQKILKVKHQLNELTKTQSRVYISTKKQTAATKTASKGFFRLGNSIKSVLGAFGIMMGAQMFVSIAKNVFSLVKTFDSLRFSMEKITGNMEDAATSERFLTRITKDFGVSLITTTNRFIKFLAAAKQSGLTLRTTENIFRSMTKAASVLGLKTDELKGVYLALEQMLSKGKVTTEELRRQLGERLPGAMGIMAASMGVTIAQLDKMLKKGEVLSAEVLPAFADAVEIAYGIDTLKKVDTLVAAQNRVLNAWQEFVKFVIDDSSKLRTVFSALAIYIDGITDRMQGLKGQRQDGAMLGEEVQSKIIQDTAEENLKATKIGFISIERLRRQKKEIEVNLAKQEVVLLQAIAKKASDEDIKIEEDRLKLLRESNSAKLQEMISYNNELTAFKKGKAADDYNGVLTEYNNALDLFSKKEKEVASLKKKIEGTLFRNYKDVVKLTSGEESLKGLNRNLGYIQGRLSVIKKLLGEDKITTPEDEDGAKTKTKKGRNIEDLTRANQIKLLELRIKFNEKNIELDNKTAEEREGIARDTGNAEVEISKLTMEQINENNEKKASIEIASWNEFAKTSKEARVQADGEIKKIQKEADAKEALSLKDHLKRNFDITMKWDDFLETERKKALDRRFALSDKEFDDLRNEAASAHKLGLTDWETYQKILTEITRQEANARLDILIEEQKIRNKSLTGKNLKIGEAKVSSLKAGKKLLKPDEDEDFTDKEKNTEKLEAARALAQALGDLGNAIFDRKIANIDAEIAAEEAKYETLFALAEGDANLERRLRIQQEEDREKLEKKKMAMQKKQAKFNKAQALVDIAINTAIGISAATKDGPLGLALIPILVTLGALQAATVLAQPLPAFAEGGIMGHDGVALVGDGGQREVMRTPDGKLSVTPANDTLVNIPKGTEIFPSIADFNNEQPSYLDSKIYSATLLASISLNQKSIEGMMFTQRELDQRLLDEMIRNTNAVKKSKSNVNLKTQSIDIPHAMWRNNFTS